MVLRAEQIAIGYENERNEWIIKSLKLSLCGDYSPPYGGRAGGGGLLVVLLFLPNQR